MPDTVILRERVPETREPLQVVLGEVHDRFGNNLGTPRYLRIPEQGLMQGIAVTGAPGTGKTAGVLNPIMVQLVGAPARIGGLVLDVKGNFYEPLGRAAARFGRPEDLQILKPGGEFTWNPLWTGERVEVLAARFKETTANLAGGKSAEHAFFTENAEGLSRLFLTVLRRTGGIKVPLTGPVPPRPEMFREHGYHTMSDLYECIVNPVKAKCIIQYYMSLPNVPDDEKRLVETGWVNWDSLHEKTKSSISSEASRLLSIFSVPEYARVFAPASLDLLTFAGFAEAINRGRIVVLNMPTGEYATGALVIGTLMKLDFFATAGRRNGDNNLRALRDFYRALCIAKDPKMRSMHSAWQATRARAEASGDTPPHLAAEIDRWATVYEWAYELSENPAFLPFIARANPVTLRVWEEAELARKEFGAVGDPRALSDISRIQRQAQAEIERWVEKALLIYEPKPGKRVPLNRSRPLVFCADEYQDFVTGGTGFGDNKAVDRLREAKVAFIVAFQMVSSVNLMTGKEIAANILGNLQTKVILRTKDKETAELAANECMKAAFIEVSKSSDDKQDKASWSARQHFDYIFQPSDFFRLPAFTAVVVGSLGTAPFGPTIVYLPFYQHVEDSRVPMWASWIEDVAVSPEERAIIRDWKKTHGF